MNQREWRLSHWCCQYLDRVLLDPKWVTAVETGSHMPGATKEQRFAWERNRKYRGIKPNALDLQIYQAPLLAFFELKVGSNRPTDNQFTTMRLVRERGIPADWGTTLVELHKFVIYAGFQLHGNAQNILRECELRHAAADRVAEVETKRPKKMPAIDGRRGEQPAAEALMSDEEMEKLIWGDDDS